MLLELINKIIEQPLIPSILAIISISLYYFVIYPLYYAPLSNIPGPAVSALTKYWMLYHTWAEHRIRLTHELHQKYGPVVRLSPCEVSISDPELVKSVYIGNFDKSQFYGQFGAYGVLNTFSSLTKNAHIKRRKIMNQFYSKSTIASPEVESMTQKRIENVMKIVNDHKNTSLDVYDMFHALAMDTVTGFILGDEYGSNYLETQDYEMIQNYRIQSAMWFWVTLMPRFYDMVMDKATELATTATAAWCREKTLAKTKNPEPNTVIDLLNRNGITGLDACAESQDHTAAGHETTGATLSFLTYHLSTNQDVQKRLHEELVEAFGVHDLQRELPYKEVDSLPYLNGVVQETLRLYAAIPGAEPRIVPPQGLKTSFGVIPSGTIISMQPWTLHRDPEAYPEPLKFKPERWYQSSPEQRRKMNKNFVAFGAGVRMCIGMNLAVQEIKLIVAQIYRIYNTSLAPDFDGEKEMFIVDKYTTHPAGHKCVLQFNKLEA